MEDNRIIKVFLDDEPKAFAEFTPPVKFILDTTKISDGRHILHIVDISSNNVKCTWSILIEVRNGPSIRVVGLKENEVINEQIPITINSYGSERNDVFVITGSETPKAIPTWVWALLIAFLGFALFYLVMYLKPDLYKSFV